VDISNLTWRTLSAAVDKIQSPSTFLQNLIYGNRIPRETSTIDIDVIIGNKKLAPFVSPVDGAGKVVSRLGRQSSTVKAPAIRLKKKLPASMFNEREAGTTIYINAQEKQKAKLRKIGMEQKDLKDQVVRRTEWMCAQSLKGEINVDQEDIKFNINFALPETHKPVLTLTAKWNDLTKREDGTDYEDVISNPIGDIEDWILLVNQDTGKNATDLILGKNAAKSFKHHPQVEKHFKNKVESQTNKGSNYLGNIQGVDIWQYAEQYTDDAGAVQYMIDPDAAVLIARGDDFELNFGVVEDLDAGGDVVLEFFSKMWKENDPSAYWLLVDSHPLPVPKRIESIVYAIVQ
jgi:hypothetical protein